MFWGDAVFNVANLALSSEHLKCQTLSMFAQIPGEFLQTERTASRVIG